MRIIISKKRLEMAVKNICRVINKKNILPILCDILCMVDKPQKRLTLTGSDSEIWLHYQVELDECDESGAFCVDSTLLKKALSELKEQPLTITAPTESDMKFKLQHETGTTVLPLENSDEYPKPQWIEDATTEWSLDSGMLKRVLKRSVNAVADDELRPIMCGVLFDQADDLLNVVASDGNILIRNAEDSTNDKGSFIMPKKAAKLLPKLMDSTDDVKVVFDNRMASFEQESMTFAFRTIEGRYPNYMNVIPQDQPHRLKVDRHSLLAAIRNVANFTNSNSRLIQINISTDQSMTLYGEDYDFAMLANDRISIEYTEGQEMKIGVKADSTIKILSMIVESSIVMSFTDPRIAITFTPDESIYKGEHLTILVMPMMIND